MAKMTRAEMFAQAKKDLDQEAENKKGGNWTPPDYEEIPYAHLEVNKPKIFRFIGNPHTVRDENWHPKMIQSSRITRDNGKQFICHWSEDRDWFLWDVYNKVTAYDWDAEYVNPDGRKGRKVYKLAKTAPKILDKVLHNGKEPFLYQGKKIEDGGWRPGRSVFMNCLCRDDYEWHKENKSFKLIAKKMNSSENDAGEVKNYYDPGIPVSAYEYILRAVVEENGAWEDFDIAIRKEEGDPWYSVYSAMDERKIKDQISVNMNSDAMTEEEMSWTKIDIDKITQVTSYRKIKNCLGKFIKSVDDELGTGFTEQLEALVLEEKAAWDASKTEEADADDEAPTKEEAPAKTEAPKTRQRTAPQKDSGSVFETMRSKDWKKVDQLEKDLTEMGAELKVDFGEDNKSTVLHISMDGEEIPFKDLIPCCDCDLPGPDIIDYCPACGTVFA